MSRQRGGLQLLSKTTHTSCNLLLSPGSAIYCILCLIALSVTLLLQSPYAFILGLQLYSSPPTACSQVECLGCEHSCVAP